LSLKLSDNMELLKILLFDSLKPELSV
jgi:hypothetical protein